MQHSFRIIAEKPKAVFAPTQPFFGDLWVPPPFSGNFFPLCLAPMAGMTDLIFRQIREEPGVDGNGVISHG